MKDLAEKIVFRTGLYSKAAQEALDFAFVFCVRFDDAISKFSYVTGNDSKCRREEDGEICFIFYKSILEELHPEDDIASYMKTRFNEFTKSLRKEQLFYSEGLNVEERRLYKNALSIFQNFFSEKKRKPKRFTHLIGKPLDPFSAAALATLRNEYQNTISNFSVDMHKDKTRDYMSELIDLRAKMGEIYKLLDRD